MKRYKVVFAGAFCLVFMGCSSIPGSPGSGLAKSSSSDHSMRNLAEEASFFEFTTGNCSTTTRCSLILTKSENLRLFKGGAEFTGKMYEDGSTFHCNELNLDGTLYSQGDQVVGIQWSDGKIWGDTSAGHPGFHSGAQFEGTWTFSWDRGHTGSFSGSDSLNIRRDGTCEGNGFNPCTWSFRDGHFEMSWGTDLHEVTQDIHDHSISGNYSEDGHEVGAFRAMKN